MEPSSAPVETAGANRPARIEEHPDLQPFGEALILHQEGHHLRGSVLSQTYARVELMDWHHTL
jgi:hypothetical protein